MKKLFYLAIVILTTGLEALSQETRVITLPMLYEAVEENHPVSSIKTALSSANSLQLENIKTTYFPKLDVNIAASWQSDVTTVNIPFPGVEIPTPDNDQYRLTLDVSQVIWDGGTTAARKKIALAQHSADISSISNEMYGVKERINDAFFSLIILDISFNQLVLMRDELNARLVSLQSGVREGVVLKSIILSLQAEIIRLEQKLLEIPSLKASLVKSLESIAQLEINVDDSFLLPEFADELNKTILRPELESFAFQKDLLDSRSNLVSRSRMPKASGFVTSGYGKPGLNMLSNEWDTYVIVGARLSWNIWDWNVTKREREQISIQKSIIDSRTKAFEDGLESAVTSVENQIVVLEKQLKLDDQVIELLEQVKKKSESQLVNGLISSTEYLTDFNAAARAKLDREQRKVQLVKEKTRLRYLLGVEL
jgi:hypothetical protein